MGNDRRDFDMVIGLADELRRFQKEGAAMLAGAREYIPLRRRIGMKRAVRAGVQLAPLSLGRLAFLARGLVSLARRGVGIFGRLRRQIEFGTQCRVVGAQCFDFPGQTFDRLRLRKNEADKRFLIKRIKRIAIHSQLESTRDAEPADKLGGSNCSRPHSGRMAGLVSRLSAGFTLCICCIDIRNCFRGRET